MSVALLGGSVESVAAPPRRVNATQAARVGREFKIKVGRTLRLGGETLRLRFVKVASDSRCPTGVECVWAGNAEVLIEAIAKGGRRGTILSLNTNASPERAAEGRYGRYVVKLTALSPYPRSNRKIRAGEYIATLLVVKSEARP
ncbi:MAG: hypothetical protein ACJ74Q_17095 [Pyrinomonadaceae bacterium]